MRIAGAFLIFIIYLVIEVGENSSGNIPMCGADILVKLLGPFSFLWGVILPIILSNQQIIKKNFEYQYVIRNDSWKSLLFRQIKKVTVASLLSAVLYIFFVILYCRLNGIVLYNWDSYDSLFNVYTQRQLEADASIVYMYAFVCIFVRCTVINHILLLFFWGCRYEIAGVFLVICLVFDEAIRGDKWICRLVSFDYRIWCEEDERLRMVVQLGVYTIAAILIYRYILTRKELIQCG